MWHVGDAKIGSKKKKYSFIVQALESFNPARIYKGPIVSASLFTNELPYLFQDRRVGIVYSLTKENLLLVNVSNSNTHVWLSDDLESLGDLVNCSLIDDKYYMFASEDSKNAYHPFAFFVESCKEALEQSSGGWCNDILIKPNFENDQKALFCYGDRKRETFAFAQFCRLPVIVVQEDGSVILENWYE